MNTEDKEIRQIEVVKKMVEQFHQDEEFKNKRFIFDEKISYQRHLFDAIGEAFPKHRILRPLTDEIPIGIGTQFGIVGFDKGIKLHSKYAALIGRSALSGYIANLTIYKDLKRIESGKSMGNIFKTYLNQ